MFGCQSVSSPDKNLPDIQVSPEEVITDNIPFTDVPPDLAPDTSEVVILQRSAMSNNQLSATAGGIGLNKIIGEIGRLSIRQATRNRWHKITFLNEFRNPVVIMQPMSYNSGDPAVIRIRNVTTLDFEFQIDEWDYLNGAHGKETVTYLVMESGLWTNGLVYEVGKVKADHKFKRVNLKYPFPSGAVILTQVQSRNDPAAVTTRQQQATGGFRVKVQEEEGADGTHPLEDIGYIATLPDEGPFGKFQALSAKTANVVSHNFRTINYSFTAPTFGDSYFLAGMQTYAGTDTASLRYRRLTNNSVQVRVEEEKSAGNETNHPNESVGYLLLRQVDFDESTLTAFDGAAEDYFGFSVAIDGNTMVVGALKDDDIGTDSGSAYIYERNAKGKWVLVQKIRASNGKAGDKFGYSVSISGDTVVVGAIFDSFSGLAYIFERNNGGSNQWGQVKILAPDGSASDSFGYSVAISKDTVVVGAHRDDDNGDQSGSAYIFERNIGGSNQWGKVTKILASDGVSGDEFGRSVAISGSVVVVGAERNGNVSGSAYIYERNNGGSNNWGEVKKIVASDGVTGDVFGNSVTISGNTLVVGAYGDDDNGDNSGSAYIFERNYGGSNNWGQVKKVLASDGAASDRFSWPVTISRDILLVGAAGNDDNGSDSGSAYVFERNYGGNNNWGQVKKVLAPDGVMASDFGRAVAVSEGTMLVGAYDNEDKGDGPGSAYIFE